MGWAVPKCRRVSLTTGHYGWRPDVYWMRWERGPMEPWTIKLVRITESQAVQWVGKLAWLGHEHFGGLGNWPDPFTNFRISFSLYLVPWGINLGCLRTFLFLEVGIYHYEPPLRPAFAASHKFWYVVFTFFICGSTFLWFLCSNSYSVAWCLITYLWIFCF